MKVLLYADLEPARIPRFEKLRAYLEAGDFRSADVKKVGDNLYRARLDHSDRLLFTLVRHRGDTIVLLLEHIHRHAYDKSRFLRRGVTIEEAKLPDWDEATDVAAAPEVLIHPSANCFHVLNKVITFDRVQAEVLESPPPFVLVGSAGSGKTAIVLEKIKRVPGEVLYVTRSPYLARHARDLYYALAYRNDDQEVTFVSFSEFLASVRASAGREITPRDFAAWFAGHRVASGFRDGAMLFEEFQGVITGAAGDAPVLSREAYRALGVRRSIFPESERDRVYDLFVKYQEFLRRSGLIDPNLAAHAYREWVHPRFDFVVIDEVQDVTTVQLDVILRSLRDPDAFILCGDANQIVHPNFFSWANLTTFFRDRAEREASAGPLRLLSANYRNAVQVTELANRILRLKIARFGSVDRLSNALVSAESDRVGSVRLLRDGEATTGHLNRATRLSTRLAVIVVDDDAKRRARERFDTPLVFTVQEAKGLEYDHVVLFDFASGHRARFEEIARDVTRDEVLGDAPKYARARDKTDKSLEIHKFYINALYVAVTRAIENVYVIETTPDHALYWVLGLEEITASLDVALEDSSLAVWRAEAHRLAAQGKEEQAEQIYRDILKIQPVPWQPLTGSTLAGLERDALEGGDKKARLLLFEYAQVYQDGRIMNELARAGYRPALRGGGDVKLLTQKYFFNYSVKRPDLMLREVEQYGVDFRHLFHLTPLMIAARLGNAPLVDALVEAGADLSLLHNGGLNAYQIAIQQASNNNSYAAEKLDVIAERLAPPELPLLIDDRLEKLPAHTMEYLLVNLMIAMFHTHLGDRIARTGSGFTAGDLQTAIASFPTTLVPERRKRREAISATLARHEITRDGSPNKRLFWRHRRGHYVINPNIALPCDGAYRPIYDLMPLDALGYRRDPQDPNDPFAARYALIADQIAVERLRAFRDDLTRLRDGRGPTGESSDSATPT
jgi:hypothetical protein